MNNENVEEQELKYLEKEEKDCEKQGKKENKKCNCNDNQIKELESKLTKLTEENAELVNKVKLAQAELINYRKRKDEEVSDLLKYANKDIIMELLQVVDNFERAIKMNNNQTEESAKFLEGFKIIYATLLDTLKKFGVEEINRAGEIFDPTLEEALVVDSDNSKKDEEVLEVLLKGYKLKDRVIRPASVKINQL